MSEINLFQKWVQQQITTTDPKRTPCNWIIEIQSNFLEKVSTVLEPLEETFITDQSKEKKHFLL